MAITDIHEDIIKTHILTRLDAHTLASAACASSRLHSLSSDHTLWSHICTTTWPSTADPLLATAISAFPSAHRSFYSDSISSPPHRLPTTAIPPPPPQSQTTLLLSSVDIKFKDELIFSKVESTDTTPSDWFQTSPFRVDLLQPKEIVVSPVKLPENWNDRMLVSELESNVSLSWILIDPTRNRAVNLSSVKPVSVQRNWLTNDIELTFGIVLAANVDDWLNCNIQVTCGGHGGDGELNLTVSGVGLTLQDVYGKCLSGRDSMVILQELAAGERCKRGGVDEGRERYRDFIERRRERKEMIERREQWFDMTCITAGIALFVMFWLFAMC